MGIRVDNNRPGITRYYDPNQAFMTTGVIAPVSFYEEFLGKTFDTTNIWTALDVSAAGNTTPVVVADAPNGVLSLPLDSTNEVQLAGITWGDQRTRDAEPVSRIRGAREAVGAADGRRWPASASPAITTLRSTPWRNRSGSVSMAAVRHHGRDGRHGRTRRASKVATGVTLTTADWAVLRIDCTDPANVLFYINGAQVAASTTFNMNQVAGLTLQPVCRIGKESAAATSALQVDYVRVWQNRS
jgi:hypothetical protein